MHYSSALSLMEEVRKLDYDGKAQVCNAFHKFVHQNKLRSPLITHFEETYPYIATSDMDESLEYIFYATNDLDSAITHIDFYNPMLFFKLGDMLFKVIEDYNGDKG